jgi:flagellar basal-body rod protein FlgG
MIRALYTSSTGLSAQQLVIDNTANNLANVNTNGFKKSLINFQDLIYINDRPPGTEAAQGLVLPQGEQIGTGVRVAGTTKSFTQGSIVNTGNQYDLSIQGDGFFQITLPNGETAYSRDGAFNINANGNLVNSSGYLVTPQISIPTNATNVAIGPDGTVSAITASSPNTSTNLGQITLVTFPNETGLNSMGSNLFTQTPASGAPVTATPGVNGLGTIQQGFKESSNVDVVSEMVNLILAQRAYEFNLRTIKTSDEMLSSTTNLTR